LSNAPSVVNMVGPPPPASLEPTVRGRLGAPPRCEPQVVLIKSANTK
jgi:hypothetical protein